LQGLGAGVVPAVAYVAISRCYLEERRPRMFAVLSTAWVVPGLVGPAVAAVVAAAVGWRWVFLGLLPLVIGAGVLVVLALRHVPPPASPGTATVPYLAVLGVAGGPARRWRRSVPAWCRWSPPAVSRARLFSLSRCAA
jgi:MFS family permease